MQNSTNIQGATASFQNQRFYWICSFVISLTGCIFLCILFRESRRNKAFKTPILQSLSILIFGDVVFTLSFLPYPAYNIINTLIIGATFIDPGESPACLLSWYFSAWSVHIELWGFVFLGYVPYTMMRDSSRLRTRSRIKKWHYVLTIAIALASSSLWFFVGLANDQLGSMKGLYCAAHTWNNFQGTFVFVLCSIAISIFAVLFYLTYREIMKFEGIFTTDDRIESSQDSRFSSMNSDRSTSGKIGIISEQTGSRGKRSKKKAKSGTKAILKFGMIMFFNFCGAYGIFVLTTAWNTFSRYIGSVPPIELEMAGALLVTVKPIADVIAISRIPTVQKEIQKRKKKVSDDAGMLVAARINSASSCGSE